MYSFRVVTPHGITYADEVDSATLPTQSGEITILANHAKLVSVLKPGELVIRKKDDVIALAVSGGVIEVRDNGEVSVLADTAERAEHIDVERAETARLRAHELLAAAQVTDDMDFARIQAAIEKEMARSKV